GGRRGGDGKGRPPQELAKLGRYGLIIIDEVGYLPFEQDAANLFFQLVSSRYEHASLILTSNLPFSGWGTVFGDQAVAAAMIDRIVHHADVLTLKGASYRLRNRGIDSLPSIKTHTHADTTTHRRPHSRPSHGPRFRPASTTGVTGFGEPLAGTAAATMGAIDQPGTLPRLGADERGQRDARVVRAGHLHHRSPATAAPA